MFTTHGIIRTAKLRPNKKSHSRGINPAIIQKTTPVYYMQKILTFLHVRGAKKPTKRRAIVLCPKTPNSYNNKSEKRKY